MKAIYSLILIVLLALTPAFSREKVAFLGDSIPYAGQWPALVENALRQTPRFADAEIVNFCLPSETVSGLSEPGHAGGAFPRPCLHDRLDNILKLYHPTVIIACYGMNDGIYMPLDQKRLKAYQKGINLLKKKAEAIKAEIIFVTPPLFRADHPETDTDSYNNVLETFGTWLVDQKKSGWKIIDIRPSLQKDIEQEKQAHPDFVYAGDGVHPAERGHEMIAHAVIDGLSTVWNAPLSQDFPDAPARRQLYDNAALYKFAWLSAAGHKRPGIPQGIPIDKLPPDVIGKATVSNWGGGIRHDFTVAGKQALLVLPQQWAQGKPWIWRTEFFGHEPQADQALLKQGFAVGYIDVSNMYGAPKALDIMDEYYQTVTKAYGLSPKTVLEGFSRGGLFAYNWASRHPGQVMALYVDAPVCDFKSWPAGKGKSNGSPEDWKRLLEVYGMTETEALAYKGNPVDNLNVLAKARIPILAVVGDADDVVPVEENTAIVETRYKKLGGPITVIHKPGCGNHPHSLKDPAPIVDFIMNIYSKKH